MAIVKKRDTTESLLVSCATPQKIIPPLIEWWFILRKDNTNFRHAEITAIESVDIEDTTDPFVMYSMVLLDDLEAIPKMIISANKKTGAIIYYPEDANGDLFVDPLTQEVARKTIYRHDISIYHCAGIMEKDISLLNRANGRNK